MAMACLSLYKIAKTTGPCPEDLSIYGWDLQKQTSELRNLNPLTFNTSVPLTHSVAFETPSLKLTAQIRHIETQRVCR